MDTLPEVTHEGGVGFSKNVFKSVAFSVSVYMCDL